MYIFKKIRIYNIHRNILQNHLNDLMHIITRLPVLCCYKQQNFSFDTMTPWYNLLLFMCVYFSW